MAVNLFNYLDRQILYAVLPLIQADFSIGDTELGALASAFMLVYMCAALPIGWRADRSDRRKWIVFGLLGWSAATLCSGLVASYRQLFAARAAVGIGESCYGAVSPSFVAEHFPEEKRAGALALFSMAIPVGSALGYILGGMIGHHWGWRAAFYWAGVPGFLLAIAAWRLSDPRERRHEPQSPHALPAPPDDFPGWKDYLLLARNRSLVSCTLAMAAMTFGLGAFAVWMPTFYTRTWGLNVSQAGILFGAVTVAAGISGSLAGGRLADRLFRRTPNSYFLVSAAGLLAALPLGWASILSGRLSTALAALFLAEFCAFLNMGPLSALIVQVTPLRVRSMAFAANIFVIHALGDAVSPTIVGYISDRAGLRPALLCAVTALGLAGAVCLWGMRYVVEDAKAAAHG